MLFTMFFAAEIQGAGFDALAPGLVEAAMGATDHVLPCPRGRCIRGALLGKGIDNENDDSQQDDFSHGATLTKRRKKGKAT
jgi:hypothetical protein